MARIPALTCLVVSEFKPRKILGLTVTFLLPDNADVRAAGEEWRVRHRPLDQAVMTAVQDPWSLMATTGTPEEYLELEAKVGQTGIPYLTEFCGPIKSGGAPKDVAKAIEASSDNLIDNP